MYIIFIDPPIFYNYISKSWFSSMCVYISIITYPLISTHIHNPSDRQQPPPLRRHSLPWRRQRRPPPLRHRALPLHTRPHRFLPLERLHVDPQRWSIALRRRGEIFIPSPPLMHRRTQRRFPLSGIPFPPLLPSSFDPSARNATATADGEHQGTGV